MQGLRLRYGRHRVIGLHNGEPWCLKVIPVIVSRKAGWAVGSDTVVTALGGLPVSALSRAFEELAELGIVARESFSCCGTCGSEEIWDERDDSRTWRGYLFYHEQDAERIPEDRETYVGYGIFLDAYLPEAEWEALSDEAKQQYYAEHTVSLMNDEVFPVLRRHGIDVSWDNDLDARILLTNVDFFAEV